MPYNPSDTNRKDNQKAFKILKESGFEVLEQRVIIDFNYEKARFDLDYDSPIYSEEVNSVKLHNPISTITAKFQDLTTVKSGVHHVVNVRYFANDCEGYYISDEFHDKIPWKLKHISLWVSLELNQLMFADSTFHRPKRFDRLKHQLNVEVAKISRFSNEYFKES